MLDSSTKTRNKEGRWGLRSWPLLCLSQFIPERKDRLLRGRTFFAYLSSMGWPGIYIICISQLDGDKDYFPLDGEFSAFIGIGLIRDNEEVVIENYLTSLIGEIRFDLQDKLLLGIILLPLLMIYSLIYWIWVFQIVHATGPWGERTDSHFRPEPWDWAFYWTYLFLGLGKWACAPIF